MSSNRSGPFFFYGNSWKVIMWKAAHWLLSAADDFGSNEEDNEFAEEEGTDEDGGSDYEEKKGKKGKKAKVEKPAKRGPKRKRPAGNIQFISSTYPPEHL